ncbi:unnamed protein product [Mytilus coruscus]|uniref:Uncharacterized protein n=1 Tax=Mytilus coruscus TaxID=42192 RepID=A0A6J8BFG6_MYTCO|nr:unnamed protein product [Mytilus coruscus]
MIDLYKPHIIHATKTHLDKQISSSEILDSEFDDIYRKDKTFQPGHEGGGVLNAVRKDLVSSREVTLDTDYNQTMKLYHNKKLDESLGRLTHNQNLPNTVLTGDSNVPDIQWKDAYSIRQQYNLEVNDPILNSTNEHNLEQQNSTPTRSRGFNTLRFSQSTKISQRTSL